jgi:nitrate reductase NapAB chaperone NapD
VGCEIENVVPSRRIRFELQEVQRVVMMTSGLIVQFDPNSPRIEFTLKRIRSATAIAEGDHRESAMAVALEAHDAAESERWLDWLRDLPGVTGVEVVFVHWDTAEGENADDGI